MQGLWTVPAHTLHALPAGLPLVDAALIEPIAVACHDVRLGRVSPGEFAVVIGGGPIGALVALVALGTTALASSSPKSTLSASACCARWASNSSTRAPRTSPPSSAAETGGDGADVVFEVSGSAPGAELMTKLGRVRARIVIVAVFPKPWPPSTCTRCSGREQEMIGTRV
jgi:threonine dehydrogenase-like Zn-dependent dehydrogenase